MFRLETLAMAFKLGQISESPGKLGLPAKDSASVVLGWDPGIFFVINSTVVILVMDYIWKPPF